MNVVIKSQFMINLRIKTIFLLISSLMILSLLACSSTELPDIEATVQARVKATLVSTLIPMLMATPMLTATPTSIPLLGAFEGTAHIVLQIGEAVHELNWNLINNSQQEVTVVTAEMHRANGSVIARGGGLVIL